MVSSVPYKGLTKPPIHGGIGWLPLGPPSNSYTSYRLMYGRDGALFTSINAGGELPPVRRDQVSYNTSHAFSFSPYLASSHLL
jgi:hypothetical protein